MKLYYCSCAGFQNIDYRRFKDVLSNERFLRLTSIKNSSARACHFCAGLLLHYVFGDERLNIKIKEKGKLYFENGPYFNISHSKNLVALAVSDYEIGVDAEKLVTFRENVAKRCFTTAELSWLNKYPGSISENINCNNFDLACFKLWTAKESIMKATGKGFSLAPESFSVISDSETDLDIDVSYLPCKVCGKDWHLKWISLDISSKAHNSFNINDAKESYILCTACEAMENIELIPLNLSEIYL